MGTESQQLIDFDLAPLLSELSHNVRKPVLPLATALVLYALAETRQTTSDTEGIMLVQVSYRKLQPFARLTDRHLRRLRNLLIVTDPLLSDRPLYDAPTWQLDLCRLFPRSMEDVLLALATGSMSALTWSHVSPDINPMSGVTFQNVSPDVTPDIRADMACSTSIRVHEHEHEDSSISHEERGKFFKIQRNDAVSIAGFGDGSSADRTAIFDLYFADAVRAGLAQDTEADRLAMLALIRCAIRRSRLPESDPLRVARPERWIYTCWQNRSTDKGLPSSVDDKRFAASRLEVPSPSTAVTPTAAVTATIDSHLEAAIDARATELATLTAEQRRNIVETIDNPFLRKLLLRSRDWTPQMYRDAARATLRQQASS